MQPDEIVKKILEGRGIVSEESVREFLSDNPQLTYDPFLMPGMEEGAGFLLGALYAGKRICIYGDYDVDGVCGTALLVLFLRKAAGVIGSNSEITYYIPSRIEEGYGLNDSAIRAIRDARADVIVTVDCGSVSPAEAAFAQEIGLDIMITDHHDPDPEKLPNCVLINPKVISDKIYPFENLAGAGVAFKLCSALLTHIGKREEVSLQSLRSSLHDLVDFVCVATIADVMPLVDENRTIVKYGLSMLRKGTRSAFRALFTVSGLKPAKLTAQDVAFVIAPRINALGRMRDASEGVEFFLTDDEERMREIALHMEQCNSERRRIQDKCFRECMAHNEAGSYFLLLRPAISHEGVAGIVAGKVRDATGLPCAILTETQDDKELLKGSARSGGRLDIVALLRRHGELFEMLGGHAAAAGFTIKKENEERLREELSMDVEKMVEKEPDLLRTTEEAELKIEISDVTTALADAICTLAPFGAGNQKPALLLSMPADRIAGVRSIGQDGKHIRFVIDGVPFVFFNGAGTRFPDTGTVMIIGCPEINEWNEYRNIQFAVRHVDVL